MGEGEHGMGMMRHSPEWCLIFLDTAYRVKGASSATEAMICAANSSCSGSPETAIHTEPSAPHTPPAAIKSTCAAVKALNASISVKTSPGTGNNLYPSAPGAFNLAAKASKSLSIRFSSPTGTISLTRRPTTAGRAKPLWGDQSKAPLVYV
jgi:hypothetical protein